MTRGERAVQRVVVQAELARGAVLVDVAEIEEAVGPLRADVGGEPAGAVVRRGGVADGPDLGAFGRLGGSRGRGRRERQQGCGEQAPHGSTKIPSLTARSPEGSEGRLTSSPRTTMPLEPPPSRLRALRAPSERITRAASGNVTPALQPGRRPSTVTSSNVPSLFTPASVRGCLDATKPGGAQRGEALRARRHGDPAAHEQARPAAGHERLPVSHAELDLGGRPGLERAAQEVRGVAAPGQDERSRGDPPAARPADALHDPAAAPAPRRRSLGRSAP